MRRGVCACDVCVLYFAAHVCRFSVHERRNKSREAEVPFEVVLTDWNTGQGAIRVKEGRSVDSRTRQHYRFYIEAEDCSSPPVRSDRLVVCLVSTFSGRCAAVRVSVRRSLEFIL